MKKNKIKSIIKIIMKIVGIIPFLLALYVGLDSAINGFSGLCFFDCERYYGFSAFIDGIILYSYVLWPTYVIGIIIFLSSMLIRNK